MAKYNRYILTFIENYCPNDLLERLNDEEIEYWALLEKNVEHKGDKFKVYHLYVELKNLIDYLYLGVILAFDMIDDTCSIRIPLCQKQDVMNYFIYKSLNNPNVILRTKFLK